jgi:hypothetical protein
MFIGASSQRGYTAAGGYPRDGSSGLHTIAKSEAVGAAGVRDVRFHDLRHTFGTRMAAVSVPPRTLQEWLGHRDAQTTAIYADYSPDERRDRDLIGRAFEPESPRRSNPRSNLSETESNSEHRNGSGVREEA